MNSIEVLLKEMDAEAIVTRKMLQLVPVEKGDWKPHEKSMSLQSLALHLAELPSWVQMALTTSELDFAAMEYKPAEIKSNSELLSIFDASLSAGRGALAAAKEEELLPIWTLRTGDKVHMVMTKYEVIRHAFSQTIHHRAQLGVYLRLLNIPIPGTYGPSADDTDF